MSLDIGYWQGYFKDDERTLRTIDEAGWLHTGDIGEWTSWGKTLLNTLKGSWALSALSLQIVNKTQSSLSKVAATLYLSQTGLIIKVTPRFFHLKFITPFTLLSYRDLIFSPVASVSSISSV